ncbi:IclR family transcriptional regulator [Ktedonobacter racemifer]|uniref:Transcriptional regulator, IclR family n=1 Tax=Ktedonobacter racemifer DSM 44963 TaxID=485913 RepID=D6U2C8_KTERA|nr:IclR family transcriptional regulator [Ktedonobacter racemifer]EFH82796.1 transcriptional regulator, IclR family [Ktedonobacter racemifer DSM 44963]
MLESQASAARGETVQTLDRGLRVLELLAKEPEGLLSQEVASRLALHRTVAYRLLNTLLEHRLIQRMDDGRYRLGMGLISLARSVQPQLQSAAVPELTRLAEELGATAHLTVADGSEAVVLTTIEPSRTHMHVVYRTGFRHPLDQAASGIAILAGREAQSGERTQVTRARQKGYAVSRSEIQQGASGIAAPIHVMGRPVEASIGIIILGDIDEDIVFPHIIAAAHAISLQLH